MQAIWNGQVIAESDATILVENNHYFPPTSINSRFFSKTETTSHCPWKGNASYYTIKVDSKVNKDAAWYYPIASKAAKQIEGYVAFWKGVEVR